MSDYHDPHLEDEMSFVMIKLMRHRGCWCCHCCCCCQNWSWCCSCWQWSRRSGTAETLEFGISIYAWDWKWTFARQHMVLIAGTSFPQHVGWFLPLYPIQLMGAIHVRDIRSINDIEVIHMISSLNRLPLLIGEMQRWIGCVPDEYAPMLGPNEIWDCRWVSVFEMHYTEEVVMFLWGAGWWGC